MSRADWVLTVSNSAALQQAVAHRCDHIFEHSENIALFVGTINNVRYGFVMNRQGTRYCEASFSTKTPLAKQNPQDTDRYTWATCNLHE